MYQTYVDMGFPEDLARMAPPDPEEGVPWLLTAQEIGTFPDSLELCSHMTFYNSVVLLNGEEHKIMDYDRVAQCVFMVAPGVSRWVPLSEPQMQWIHVRHDPKPRLEILQAHEEILLPPLHLPKSSIPNHILERIDNNETLIIQDLMGNWDFMSGGDAALWLGVLRLCNKNDPSVRFEPDVPQPPSTTSLRIQNKRNEIKDRIMLYSILERNPSITVQSIIDTPEEDYLRLITNCRYRDMFRSLRYQYWHARDMMRQRVSDWRNACIAPLQLVSIDPNDESTVSVRLALTEWTFKKNKNDISHGLVPFYLAYIFKHVFPMTLERCPYDAVDVPDILMAEQVDTFQFLNRVEKEGAYPGWFTRQDNGTVWSYSYWGACVKGLPPTTAGGILSSPIGTGKTMLMTLLCAKRNLSTVVIVPKKKRIQHWLDHFNRFAPELTVHGLEKRCTPWNELADVVVTTWPVYKNHPECDGPWSRLIIDDAQLIKTNREKCRFLSTIDARFVWLCTHHTSVTTAFRSLLHLDTTALDDMIVSPPCDIQKHLSPVVVHQKTFPMNDINDLLCHAFKTFEPDKKPKSKYSRMAMWNHRAAPLHMYAHTFKPKRWSPNVFQDMTDQNIQKRLQEPCPICYEENKTSIVTDCGHVFCEECITRATESTYACPCCRNTCKKFFFDKHKDYNYCFDRQSRRWGVLYNTVVSAYNTGTTRLDQLIAYAKETSENHLLVVDQPIEYPRSVTVKQLEKSGTSYNHIEHVLCVGTPTDSELDTIKTRISKFNDKNTRHIHICT